MIKKLIKNYQLSENSYKNAVRLRFSIKNKLDVMLNVIKETDSAFNNECLQQSLLMTHTCTKRVTSSTDIALSYRS